LRDDAGQIMTAVVQLRAHGADRVPIESHQPGLIAAGRPGTRSRIEKPVQFASLPRVEQRLRQHLVDQHLDLHHRPAAHMEAVEDGNEGSDGSGIEQAGVDQPPHVVEILLVAHYRDRVAQFSFQRGDQELASAAFAHAIEL
jgi:hypothetical protein